MKQQTTGYSRHNEGGTRTKPRKDTVTPYGRAGSLSHDSQCQLSQERGASERPYSRVAREHGPYAIHNLVTRASENVQRGEQGERTTRAQVAGISRGMSYECACELNTEQQRTATQPGRWRRAESGEKTWRRTRITAFYFVSHHALRMTHCV